METGIRRWFIGIRVSQSWRSLLGLALEASGSRPTEEYSGAKNAEGLGFRVYGFRGLGLRGLGFRA